MQDYWQKQGDTPLFEHILWSKPENRMHAGKLLVIGGNAHGFSAVAEAYRAAATAGAGAIHIILPDALRKTVGSLLPDTEFCPSTPSGSFARDSLGTWLTASNWSDGVLLAGDLGRNSETSIVLESFLNKYQGPLTITKDVVDYFYELAPLAANRDETTLVLSLAQLQKLGTALKFQTPFLLGMGMMLLAQALHDFTKQFACTIITKELDTIVVARAGQVSSTKMKSDTDIWRVNAAARAATFWMQHPASPFEAMTTAFTYAD